MNKVISRVLHGRLEEVLPSLILKNQSVFITKRSTTENVLLVQEIISRIRGKPTNEDIKLVMSKAYDRVN